jgi:lipid-binding SYLF domain-containing protein
MAACTTQQTDLQSTSGPTESVTQADPTLDADCKAALAWLYSNTPKAKELGDRAKGILVFPEVIRAGFIGGVAHGAGILYENGKATGSYATTSGTFGLQAGVQTYAYVMFFETDHALSNLKTNHGFSFGVAPTIVVADQGAARNLNTTTLESEIYAFIFDQKGLWGAGPGRIEDHADQGVRAKVTL